MNLADIKNAIVQSLYKMGYGLGKTIGTWGANWLTDGFKSGLSKALDAAVGVFTSSEDFKNMIDADLKDIISDLQSDLSDNVSDLDGSITAPDAATIAAWEADVDGGTP